MATATRRQPPEAIRAAIIEATVRVIGRHGVDGVTHRAVAAEADVSLSSTTYHFASKDEIVSAAFASGNSGIAGLGAILQRQHDYITGLNDILLTASFVAFAGAVLGFALVRTGDLVASEPQQAQQQQA
jgi:AcrR family transcriptional regulator